MPIMATMIQTGSGRSRENRAMKKRAGDEPDRGEALLEPVLELGRPEDLEGERQEQDVPQAEREEHRARRR